MEKPLDNSSNSVLIVRIGYLTRQFFDRIRCVAHGYSHSRKLEHFHVIVIVAYCYHLLWYDVQLLAEYSKASRLGDALWQNFQIAIYLSW